MDKFDAIKARAKEKRRLLAKSPWCRWCRRALSYGTATLEHIQPVSLGGTDARANLALACKKCNAERGNDVRWSKRNGASRSSTAERLPYKEEVAGSTPAARTTQHDAEDSHDGR